MPRYVGKPLIAKVHVVDSNGDPVTGATVSYRIYHFGEVEESGTMTHSENGLYQFTWVPTNYGPWTFEAYCTNPQFRKTYLYHVEEKQPYQAPLTGTNSQLNPVQNTWYVFMPQQSELSDQRKLYYVFVSQTNNEAAAKDVELIFDIDNVRSINMSATLESGTKYYIQIACDANSNYTYEFVIHKAMVLETVSKNDDSGDIIIGGMPLECVDFVLQMRMTSAPGTGQRMDAWSTMSICRVGSGDYD